MAQQAAGRIAGWLAIVAFAGLPGCHHQQQTEQGKTYMSDQKSQSGSQSGSQTGSQSGGQGSGSGGQGNQQPLNAPADTTNGRPSRASDSGTSDATHGVVVAQPGSPPENDPRRPPPTAPKQPPPGPR
ncbi:MAG TPA: hypothetical protein VGD62_05025 [Acidobacteriaceae bacterium]